MIYNKLYNIILAKSYNQFIVWWFIIFQFYEIIWMFTIYSFLGWCVEVSFAACKTGKFVNRGFLNGPVCPIYGFGATIVIVCLSPILDNIFILFIGSVLLTSILELITGFLLEKIFQQKWWDYSNAKFNIGGYICLRFSVIWGVACTFTLKIVQPLVYGIINIIPDLIGEIVVYSLQIILIIDFIVTILSIQKLNKRLKLLNDIAQKLKYMSNTVGESISEKSINLSGKITPIRHNINEELIEKYKDLLNKNIKSHNRLMKAFPNLKSQNYHSILKILKDIHAKN